MVCAICGRGVERNQAGVCVHVDGGGAIWQYCRKCHWQESKSLPARHCPCCDSPLYDDHIAVERRS